MIDLKSRADATYTGVVNTLETAGMATVGRTVTATLRVSPNGDNSDGLSWATAYTTIQAALNAASTDAYECTLILIGPHPTWYDINTTGDPTWTGNYHLMGTHRIWATIKNTHASATSVMKFTGKVAIEDLAISTQGGVDGVIFTGRGWRVRKCGFNSSACNAANTSVTIDGTAAVIRGGIIEDVQFFGNVAYTTAVYLNKATVTEMYNVDVHFALTAIHVLGTGCDNNFFHYVDIGGCALGIDIDEGDSQHFENIHLHETTVDIDDEVGNHHWNSIIGQFPINIEPDNFTGVAVATGDGADTWTTSAVTLRTAGAIPFKILGSNVEADANEKFRLQLFADGVVFSDIQFEGTLNASRRRISSASTETDYVFNKGVVISAKSKSESAGVDTVTVWLIVQEIQSL